MQATLSPSAAIINDDDSYRRVVLKTEQSEDAIDRQLEDTAFNLGIDLATDSTTPIDLISDGISALGVNVDPSEDAAEPDPPRASQSIHTASDSSIERHRHRKTPSLAATSITSASLSSIASNKSNIAKVRKSFRRISRFQRKKPSTHNVPDIPQRASSALEADRPEYQDTKVRSVENMPNIAHLQPHAISTDQMHHPDKAQQQVMSITYDLTVSPPPNPATPSHLLSPFEEPGEESLELIAARRRSISNPKLKDLRTSHLQEQLRFISFEASQHRLMRTKQLQQRRDALSQYQQQQEDTNNAHAEALASLENRHLTAEAELHRTLQVERQACDTRLKHMQAYCNPRSNVQDMPSRVVTKADYRQLEQQYHIRNGMDNLHSSRINVLRERQAKQLERIMAKQETELERLETDFEKQNDDIDATFHAEELQSQQIFAERRNRLTARWNMAEAIERKKLEMESGEEHGALPVIAWVPRRPSTSGSLASSSSPVSSFRQPSRDGQQQPPDAASVYDALNMI